MTALDRPEWCDESTWYRILDVAAANVAKAPPLTARQKQTIRDAFLLPDVRPRASRRRSVDVEHDKAGPTRHSGSGDAA